MAARRPRSIPLHFWGALLTAFCKTRTGSALRERISIAIDALLVVIARSVSDEAIQTLLPCWIASLSLAMTK
jgi:VanZ family protein